MGRSGVRAKASGGTLSGEGLLKTQYLSLNLTLFQFLQTGYFEKDLLSYCANRLADYSCIYWLNPNVDEDTETVELHTAAYHTGNVGWTTPANVEFTKYPSQFINLDRDRPTGVTVVQTLTDGEPITGTFLGPVNVREVVLTEHGISVAVVESNRLPLDAVARVVLPFLLFIACICNLFILRTAYKLSCRRIPLAIYLVYIATLDQIDLLARGTDYLVEAYGGIRLFTAVQFLDRSACQLLTMIHSGLRHLHASLLIGFAIDTLRFARHPSNYAAVYRREWTRNVLILSAVLAITIDSQFLWTFDLSLLHTKTLHKRLVRKACECGFSTTTTLSPLFVNLIWPLIDHMWTEIIPFTVCAILGTCTLVTLQLRRRRISVPGQNTLSPDTKLQTLRDTSVSASTDFAGYFKTVVYRWFDGHTIHEAPKAYGLLVVTDCLFIAPRTIYYLTKYAMFANFYTTRDGSPFFNYDTPPEHPNLVAIIEAIRRADRLRPYEVPLEGVEAAVRYLGCVHIICRAIVLVRRMTVLRKQLVTHWHRFERIFRWGKCRTGKSSRLSCFRENKRSSENDLIPTTKESIQLNQSSSWIMRNNRGRKKDNSSHNNGPMKAGAARFKDPAGMFGLGDENPITYEKKTNNDVGQTVTSQSADTQSRTLQRKATSHTSKSLYRSLTGSKANVKSRISQKSSDIAKPPKELYSL